VDVGPAGRADAKVENAERARMRMLKVYMAIGWLLRFKDWKCSDL